MRGGIRLQRSSARITAQLNIGPQHDAGELGTHTLTKITRMRRY